MLIPYLMDSNLRRIISVNKFDASGKFSSLNRASFVHDFIDRLIRSLDAVSCVDLFFCTISLVTYTVLPWTPHTLAVLISLSFL